MTVYECVQWRQYKAAKLRADCVSDVKYMATVYDVWPGQEVSPSAGGAYSGRRRAAVDQRSPRGRSVVLSVCTTAVRSVVTRSGFGRVLLSPQSVFINSRVIAADKLMFTTERTALITIPASKFTGVVANSSESQL